MSVYFFGRTIVWPGECTLQPGTENLTPGEPRCGIFLEFSGCAHILPFPGAEVE
jgi:hypothetical protein